MKELSTKLLIEMLESMLEVYLDVTRLAKQTDEFRDECKQAYQQIKQRLSQSERQVDEKHINEKARELLNYTRYFQSELPDIKDFLNHFASEIQKPRITKEFVEKYAYIIRKECFGKVIEVWTNTLIKMLKEAGCEMEE